MPNEEQPDDKFEAELEKIGDKPVADAADRQEEADVLKTEAHTALVHEVVESSRANRLIMGKIAKYIVPCTIIYTIVPVALAILQGFSIGGFNLAPQVLVAAFAPPGVVALIGLIKSFRK
jgi:hypothetical protein